jgi:peptide-methionine (R)-S-oxide reductase
MNRRTVITTLFSLPVALTLGPLLANARTQDDIAQMHTRWAEFLPDDFVPPNPGETVTQSEEQWRAQLSAEAFNILREEGTERPFSSPLNEEKRRGVFLCAGCDLPLFSSETKYDSGTGWPSFFTHIPGALETKRDFKLVWPRTEYHCIRCGGHQGHVFDDGPAPTNQRWCNNGLALRFLESDSAS